MVVMLALSMIVSCDGDTPRLDKGKEQGSGGNTKSPFTGTYVVESLSFKNSSGMVVVQDDVYMKVDDNSVIFYIPAFGSTEAMPYQWYESESSYIRMKIGDESIATLDSTYYGEVLGIFLDKEFFNHILEMYEVSYESYSDYLHLSPYLGNDVVIEPDMHGLDFSSLPKDNSGMLTIGFSHGRPAVTDCSREAEYIEIPNGIEVIGSKAFEMCFRLKSVTIPNSITEIGASAFRECNNLKSIEIPYSITVIGDYAFCECINLTSIKIPYSVTVIGDYAFCDCENITSITIYSNGTEIGYSAFAGCLNLINIVIPSGVSEIKDGTFANCTKLRDITIREGVTSIGDYAFQNCSNLEDIYIPDSVTSIGNDAFTPYIGTVGLKSISLPLHFADRYQDLNLPSGCKVTVRPSTTV